MGAGRLVTLLSWVPALFGPTSAHNTVVVRRMWDVLPYSPCMVDDGAHNTVDVQRHVEGAILCLSGMGVEGAHSTVGQMSTPTTLLGFCHAWKVAGHPSDMSYRLLTCRCAGYSPWYCGRLECSALLAPPVSWSSLSGCP